MIREIYHTKLHYEDYLISKGWIAKMKLSNMSELDDLMDEAAYSNFVKESEEE